MNVTLSPSTREARKGHFLGTFLDDGYFPIQSPCSVARAGQATGFHSTFNLT